jgi:hypothetical protein
MCGITRKSKQPCARFYCAGEGGGTHLTYGYLQQFPLFPPSFYNGSDIAFLAARYALNLKQEFPRIPFYADFWRWAEWGEKLMALHIGYETVEPWPLERIEEPGDKSRKAGLEPKAMLRANKESGNIQLDSETQLAGVPPEAWTYRLGNRSADSARIASTIFIVSTLTRVTCLRRSITRSGLHRDRVSPFHI